PSNFLLLDEPTNHLDLRAKDILLEALQGYSGTLVFVSHDRYFIDKLATRVFEIADQRVNVYPGNYEDYLWRKNAIAAPEVEPEPEAAQAPPAPVETDEARPKRLNPIRLRQLKERRESLEEEIARLEAEIAGYESALADFRSAEETIRLADLLARRRAGLEGLLAEWEEVSTQIEGQ
ncbi:MAG: ABC transporter ATP-binding protein, partial [Bryobacteraceae bacterium]